MFQERTNLILTVVYLSAPNWRADRAHIAMRLFELAIHAKSTDEELYNLRPRLARRGCRIATQLQQWDVHNQQYIIATSDRSQRPWSDVQAQPIGRQYWHRWIYLRRLRSSRKQVAQTDCHNWWLVQCLYQSQRHRYRIDIEERTQFVELILEPPTCLCSLRDWQLRCEEWYHHLRRSIRNLVTISCTKRKGNLNVVHDTPKSRVRRSIWGISRSFSSDFRTFIVVHKNCWSILRWTWRGFNQQSEAKNCTVV